MRCKVCNREIYIAHICPYCKEFYCMEHRDPKSHSCQVYGQMGILTPPTSARKIVAKEVQETPPHPTIIQNFQKNLFTCTFTTVLIEEILRLISYLRYSPYIESNIYIVLLSQIVTPYIASSIFFLTICAILFATKRLSEKVRPVNEFKALIAHALPILVYVTVIVVYAFSIINWLLIIAP